MKSIHFSLVTKDIKLCIPYEDDYEEKPVWQNKGQIQAGVDIPVLYDVRGLKTRFIPNIASAVSYSIKADTELKVYDVDENKSYVITYASFGKDGCLYLYID